MLFQYRYIDGRGKKKKGLIEALHADEAKQELRRQKILLISLVPTSQKKKGRAHLKKEALITFTAQLAGLLQAGMPLYESLLSLEEQYREDPFHPILLTLCEKIKGGCSLSEAMGQFPGSFNRLYCSMVAAGESVGALDKTLDKLAALLLKQNKLKKQIITALIYPALLFSFSMVVMGLLLTFVIPSLEALFEDRAVNRFTKTVMVFSNFLTHKWIFYIPLGLAAATGSYLALKSEKGKRWIQKQLLRTPLLKTLIIQTAIARFSRTMGTLLEGGVSLIQALQIARKVMRNPFFEEVVERAEKNIIEGSLLSVELKKSPLFPSLVTRMLAIGEEGGNASGMLQKIADLYEEEVEKSLSRLTALAQPVILVFMGGIVGMIMIAVLLPLTDVSAFL
ncbi:MAG: type II secretion system F family protein [Chlamydiales bacterium]|nr:type II secretion system F family protein [Chlamydiales bacterium]